MSARAFLVCLRLTAIALIITVVPLMWNFMLWLPWQVDCALATAAAFAFAYAFEREPGR